MLKNVSFEKPNYAKLNEQGFSMFDMHVHTKYSDGANGVPSILKKAKKLGIGLAITDHNEIIGALKAYTNTLGVKIIPGIELTTFEGSHLLFYFTHPRDLEDFYIKYIKDKKLEHPNFTTNVKTKEIIKHSKKYKCILSVAHPFAPSRLGLFNNIKKGHTDESVLRDLPTFEVLCGSNLKGMNKKSIEWAWQLNKSITGGSDAHALFEIGKIVTYSKAKDLESFFEDIKNKKNFVVGKEPINASRLVSYSPGIYHNYIRRLKPALKVKYQHVIKGNIKRNISKLKETIKNGFKGPKKK
ncbi:PHP domain-containing protein [Candidatus Woesearchaeota archaeon]|nr:PHP domain-containing protein [Candidatus Woesearchaeota archaeon]